MSGIKLPADFRPENSNYRRFRPGLDLPAEFYYGIKGIDSKLYFIYHEIETLYEDVMTNYSQKIDNPSWNIHCDANGKEIWGYPLTLPDGSYKFENRWHLWSLTPDIGWSHVSNVASEEPSHLNRIINRLGKEKLYKARYGAFEWNHKLRQDNEEREAQLQAAKDGQFKDIQGENKAFTKKAMENLGRGITAPTNPTREIITSYKGQGNRTKIVRPLTDKEGGLVTLGEN